MLIRQDTPPRTLEREKDAMTTDYTPGPLPESDATATRSQWRNGAYQETDIEAWSASLVHAYTRAEVKREVAAAVAQERERFAAACDRFADATLNPEVAQALRDMAALVTHKVDTTGATPNEPT